MLIDQSRNHNAIETRQNSEERGTLASQSYARQVLPPAIGGRGMIALFIFAVFWPSNVNSIVSGDSSSITYWLIGIVFFFGPCCLVTAQLGYLFPYEGSLYNWTYNTMGPFWSFFVGLCAWLPGVLSIVSAAFVVVNSLQSLNSTWLVPVWQQGLSILAVLALTAFLSTRRYQVVQIITNIVASSIGVVLLLAIAACVFWLLRGHPSATNFANAGSWQINLDSQTGNSYLIGAVVLALLGSTMPLTLAGELRDEKAVTRHVTWGFLLIVGGYLLLTVSLLVIQGANKALAAPNPIALLIGTVDVTLGKPLGDLMAMCLLLYFLILPTVENIISSRLLFSAAADQRLTAWFGSVNKNRVPVHALLFQVGAVVVYTVLIYFVLPQFAVLGNPATVTVLVYTVTAACLLIVWAFSFLFPFIIIAVLYVRKKEAFMARRIIPFPLLAISVVTGPLMCLITIYITLRFSFIPQLMDNALWEAWVGGGTFAVLALCMIGSMLSQSEASWEALRSE